MKFISFFACSVCFGDPASFMSKGVVAGVVALLAVVVVVLGAIAFIAVSWSGRAKNLQKTAP